MNVLLKGWVILSPKMGSMMQSHTCAPARAQGEAEALQAWSIAPSGSPATWPQRLHYFSRRKRPPKNEGSPWFKHMYF